MRSNSLGKESVVVQIPQNISNFFLVFLMIPFFTAEVEVVGKRLNRGSSYGLEISVRYHFDGQEKIVQDSSGCAIADWKFKNGEKELERKISKFLKQITLKKHLTNRFLYYFSLAAKITLKLFIVSANCGEKKAK